MDVDKTLRELYEEKRRLDVIIASLEANLDRRPLQTPNRRGRKSMSPQERQKVSRRMKRYWENRRAKTQSSETSTPARPVVVREAGDRPQAAEGNTAGSSAT